MRSKITGLNWIKKSNLKMVGKFERYEKGKKPNRKPSPNRRGDKAIKLMIELEQRYSKREAKALYEDFVRLCEGKPTKLSMKALRDYGVLRLYTKFMRGLHSKMAEKEAKERLKNRGFKITKI